MLSYRSVISDDKGKSVDAAQKKKSHQDQSQWLHFDCSNCWVGVRTVWCSEL